MAYHVEVIRVLPAPIEKVFDRYTDHVGWTRWARLGRVVLAERGTPEENGVGAVREITTGGVRTVERVVAFERPRHMAYALVRGPVPMKNHLGEVDFESCEGGTRVRWRCRFDTSLPLVGPLMQLVVRGVFEKALDGLAARGLD